MRRRPSRPVQARCRSAAAHDAVKLVPSAELLPLPDKPSIAVLPFQNMSHDPEQEYFADGLTEDIITGLSRQRWFFVIARNSSFTYKGAAVDVRDVAAQLGVRYVLEGSVRKAANRVRVTGQLIDASNGNHLWAEKYDRELADIFALQDDITNRVIGSVAPQILVAEAARVQRKPPQSVDAWDLVMQAVPHMWRMSTDEHARAQELLQRAIALDGNYAHAHALLGWTYVTMFNLDTRRPIGEWTDRALATGATAATLDDEEPWAHLVLGLGHARRRRPQLAFRHLTKSVELSPSFALGYAGLGYALACGGQPESGLQALEEAHRLSPRDPFLAIYAPTVRYMALFALARYEETIAVCRATTASHPNHAGAWRLMTVSLGLLGTDRRSKGRARPYPDAATRSFQRPCGNQHGLRESGRSGPLPRGAPKSRIEELARTSVRRRRWTHCVAHQPQRNARPSSCRSPPALRGNSGWRTRAGAGCCCSPDYARCAAGSRTGDPRSAVAGRSRRDPASSSCRHGCRES